MIPTDSTPGIPRNRSSKLRSEDPAFLFGEPSRRNHDRENCRRFSPKTRIDRLDLLETPQKEARSYQEDERNGHLGDDEEVPQGELAVLAATRCFVLECG